MTTWHSEDSLERTLEFFLDCTAPDEKYAPNGCDVGLVISVGSRDWDRTIERHVRARTTRRRRK